MSELVEKLMEGKPSKPSESEVISFRPSLEVRQRIQEISEKTGKSRANVVRLLVESGLEQLKDF
jgi:predicted DNA-binding protein